MAKNPTLAVASKNLALNAALDVANAGFIEIYDGAQPASPDVAVTTQVKLAKLSLSATAFAAAAAGAKVANAITPSAILANGTAAWYRIMKSDDVTGVHDGSVGTSGATSDCVVPTTTYVILATATVSALTISM